MAVHTFVNEKFAFACVVEGLLTTLRRGVSLTYHGRNFTRVSAVMLSLCLCPCLYHFRCLRCSGFQSGYLGMVCQITFAQWLRILIRFLNVNILGPSHWHLLNKTFRGDFRYVIRNLIIFKMNRFLYQNPWKLVLSLAIKLILENRKDATQLYKHPVDPFYLPE